jgi:hypothetical protein
VISWFQKFTFKWVNLGRYAAVASMARRVAELEALLADKEIQLCAAGLCRLNQVDP